MTLAYLLLGAACTSFGAAFLKIFQQKNIIGNHLKTAAATSYLIAGFDVAVIMLIIKGGWYIALATGTGGAIGVVLSVKLHQRIFGKPGN
jgi:hypothetical protein